MISAPAAWPTAAAGSIPSIDTDIEEDAEADSARSNGEKFNLVGEVVLAGTTNALGPLEKDDVGTKLIARHNNSVAIANSNFLMNCILDVSFVEKQ